MSLWPLGAGYTCRVSCAFWRTGEASRSGGDGQEKQGEGCVVATSMLGLLGSLGRILGVLAPPASLSPGEDFQGKDEGLALES